WKVGSGGVGTRNFAWPLAAWIGKWAASFEALRTESDKLLAATTLLSVLALTAQAAYLIVRRRPEDAWWRAGAGYAALFLVLGGAVWEGHPGAAPRVLLPLTLAFNVLCARHRVPLWWLITGNLAVAAGLLAMKDVPRDPAELAFARAGGRAAVARSGNGWYGLERDRVHRWMWSGGAGEIALEGRPRDASPVPFQVAVSWPSPPRV